jgi:hypothetical protein
VGLINLEPTLRAGEEVLWRQAAAFCVEDHTVGGVLYATSIGLVFMPNRLNRRRDLVSQRIAREDQPNIAVAPPDRRWKTRSSGGMRHRVRVETRHGDVYLFVVNHPDQVAQQLRELIAGAPGQA